MIHWPRGNRFYGFLGTHQFLNNGFWNPLIFEQWVLEPINFGKKSTKTYSHLMEKENGVENLNPSIELPTKLLNYKKLELCLIRIE